MWNLTIQKNRTKREIFLKAIVFERRKGRKPFEYFLSQYTIMHSINTIQSNLNQKEKKSFLLVDQNDLLIYFSC